MKCWQFVSNDTGVFHPECSKSECSIWMYKREKCGILTTILNVSDINYKTGKVERSETHSDNG